MNARTSTAAIVTVALISLTACSAAPTGGAEGSQSGRSDAAAASCNLTLEWDPGLARYEAGYIPTVTFLSADDLPRTRYVASDSCDLADIVRWTDLRVARSQPGDVCQFAWRYDELGQVDVVACITVRRVS